MNVPRGLPARFLITKELLTPLNFRVYSKRAAVFQRLSTRDVYGRIREQIQCLEVRLWQLFQYSARTWEESRMHNVT